MCIGCRVVVVDEPGQAGPAVPLAGPDRLLQGIEDQRRAHGGGGAPVGFQNSATGLDLGFYAARSYALRRPPRTGRRLIRS